MSDNTAIEWTDATWNPITGCTMVSAGCSNCYAMGLAATRLRFHPSRAGLTRESGGRAVWTGETRLNEQWLDQPLRWRRPRMIFVCAHGDLFHESVPDEWIDRVFAVMALAPQHTFQVLTKRPERMRSYMTQLHDEPIRDTVRRMAAARPSWKYGADLDINIPAPNVWLGTSVEDQPTADARIPHLLATPAAVRFISAEPLLGPVDLSAVLAPEDWGPNPNGWRFSALETGDGFFLPNDDGFPFESGDGPHRDARLDWVIVGGESGPGARPMHPDWARSLRDQCAAAGVPFFFKQWGEWGCDDGPAADGSDPICDGRAPCATLAGGQWRIFPNGYQPPLDQRTGEWVYRLGKRAAGRLLDGRAHDAMPGAAR